MARRFVGLRQRMVSAGRKTFWFTSVIAEDNLPSASSAVIVTSLNAAALALRPFTIIRTRGFVAVRSDQSGVDEKQQVAFGGIIVSDQAAAIGITAVPTPVTDDQSTWFFLQHHVGRFEFITGTGVQANMVPWMRDIDSKSMRKVEEGQTALTIAENSATSDGTDIVTYARMLIKLH